MRMSQVPRASDATKPTEEFASEKRSFKDRALRVLGFLLVPLPFLGLFSIGAFFFPEALSFAMIRFAGAILMCIGTLAPSAVTAKLIASYGPHVMSDSFRSRLAGSLDRGPPRSSHSGSRIAIER